MTTYLVFTRLATTDQSEMDVYSSKVGATFAGHPVTPLAAYGAQEILEGSDHEGMVVLAFPDKEAALGWYQSPAYQEARAHRFKGASYQVTLTEGL
ncbi:DUF1330 domain-containing protein [Sphingomonas sp. BIUV-7]|uniref:DUF1330 domain-containing protein n=1 Tax=Sphingomonas natans TaxID=3063330 RepID=A0ABT8Y845_9SPHN|nr:DUF1330 domain-containing protein [Sphingomonas sp. BIUV-7]MDO6414490.1 DUF1330 domain-containing protein [Sphingomonas sp. BIUV-7]